MGQVSFYRNKSTPLEKFFQAPPKRKILDPYPSVDKVPPVEQVVGDVNKTVFFSMEK